MDGLGYGDDGRLWGGEVFVCDLLGYRRVAHLEELPLPGGAAAIENPWRTALGWSYALLGEDGLGRAARLLRSRAAAPRAPPHRRGLRRRPSADRRRRQRAADDELRSPVRRRRRARRRAPRDHLRGPGGDRARDALRGRRRAVSIRRGRGRSRPPPARRAAAPASGSSSTPPGRTRAHRRPWCGSRRCSRPCSTTSRPARRRAPSAPACTPRWRPSSARSAAGCARPPASTWSPWPAASSRTGCWPMSAKPCSSPMASRCSPRASCPVNDGGVALGQAAVAGYTALRRRGDLR